MTEKIRNRVTFHLLETRDVKLSPSMIDAFVSFNESKTFVPSDSLIKIREDSRNVTIPGKIDYILSDGSIVAITPKLNEAINKDLGLEALEKTKGVTASLPAFLSYTENLLNSKDINKK